VKCLDGRSRAVAELAPNVAIGVEDVIAEDHRPSAQRYGFQAKLVDQIAYRVLTEARVVVQLGRSGFVEYWRSLE
jgi:hypothetical protein